MPEEKLKVLMVTAEVAPFAKVGGLADVVGSLPPALAKLGLDVRIIMPFYGSIIPQAYGLKKAIDRLDIYTDGKKRPLAVWAGELPGAAVPVYFIDAPYYFGGREVYLKSDNAERFLFFSLASLYALPHLGFQPDIIHCHDFHTALIPDLLKAQQINFYKKTKTVYTIHNLNYQGQSGVEVLSTGNLSEQSLASLSRDACDGDINFMVQGILNAEAVTTVSPTYAREITTYVYGADLERIIRKRKKDLTGILNGIDTNFFDPARDMPLLHRTVDEAGGVSVLVLDPIVSAIQGDSHKNAEVRRGLQPIVDFAAATDAAVIGITHLSKGTGGQDPVDRITGSLAFGAVTRLAFLVAREDAGEEGSSRRVITRAKSNIGPDG
ncbi:MAG: glycogen/starch synthase, partial [Planctomycetes bacterium]|nr:glycogen/starch synthase [Planctomycetota bacterium]